jgi:hypothetical protein
MIRPRTRRLLVSAAVLAGSGLITAWVALDDGTASEPMTTGAIRTARPPIAQKTLPPSTTFAVIAQRPLFLPLRRPEPEAPPPRAIVHAAAPVVAPPSLAATLVGVLMSPEGNSAILRLSDGKTATVREGATIEGWTLQHVSPDHSSFLLGSTSLDVAFPLHQPKASRTGPRSARSVPVVRRRR